MTEFWLWEEVRLPPDLQIRFMKAPLLSSVALVPSSTYAMQRGNSGAINGRSVGP